MAKSNRKPGVPLKARRQILAEVEKMLKAKNVVVKLSCGLRYRIKDQCVVAEPTPGRTLIIQINGGATIESEPY